MKILLVILSFSLFSCLKSTDIKSYLDELNAKIHEVIYTDPKEFLGDTYCYYVFQGVLNENQITPKLYSKFIKGGSLSLKYINEYNLWLNSTKGKNCVLLVAKHFKKLQPNKSKEYGIFLNQKAITDEGKNIEITRNHERLHIAFSLYKKRQLKVKQLWENLPNEKKQSFIDNHPGYNFKNKNILLKEYFAYTYQSELEKGLLFLLTDPQ